MSFLLLVGAPVGGGSPPPPVLVSATILSNGTTLRLVFDQPITSGNATAGLSRSVSSISSGSIVSGTVDLTIPKVYAGDIVGTISYTPGTLAGDTGAVAAFGPVVIVNNAAAWTPAELPGIVDFGIWSDLTRLRQNSDGTGAVANVDDPVGWWRGQLDVLTFTQPIAGNKPKLAANGVYFLGAGSVRFIDANLPRNHPAPFTLALKQSHAEQSAQWRGMFIWRRDTASRDSIGSARVSTTSAVYAATRGGASSTLGVSTAAQENLRTVLTWNGSSSSAWRNGTDKTAITPGSATNAVQQVSLTGTVATTDAKAVCWVVTDAGISDADAALLDAWLVGV